MVDESLRYTMNGRLDNASLKYYPFKLEVFINVSSATHYVDDHVYVCVVRAGDIYKLILITIAVPQNSAKALVTKVMVKI